MNQAGGCADTSRRILVREAIATDLVAIQQIYAAHVLTGLGTFEETPPPSEELAQRRARVLKLGLPYLVAGADGSVVGFCYAAPYRSRSAYRFALEDSVYVAPSHGGRGVGTALLGRLIEHCEKGPWRQMIAVIGDSANCASVSLHRKCGFNMIGTLSGVGFKFGRWINTPIMQRTLGEGDARAPQTSGLETVTRLEDPGDDPDAER